MAAWLEARDLRSFVQNAKTNDEAELNLAVDVACGLVDERCGPTLLTTITDEPVFPGRRSRALLSVRVRELISVRDAETGAELPGFTAWRQSLRRRDRSPIGADLLVTYTTGADEVPAWAKSAALHIGQQYLRTMRRFGQTSDGPVGFLVPKVAMEEMEDHLLIAGLS